MSFRYSRRGPWVLRDVELTLTPGSVIEVTGRNGAGKSTLLRLLAGIVPPPGARSPTVPASSATPLTCSPWASPSP
ncbi:ATP-binding cassette domain-containing protein [Streptosporangium lutulentum]